MLWALWTLQNRETAINGRQISRTRENKDRQYEQPRATIWCSFCWDLYESENTTHTCSTQQHGDVRAIHWCHPSTSQEVKHMIRTQDNRGPARQGARGKLLNHWQHIDFYTFSLFLWCSGERGKLHNHWKHIDFYTFSLFLWWSGERGKLQNPWNIWISIHFHYFFGGTESVGNSRIIEKT